MSFASSTGESMEQDWLSRLVQSGGDEKEESFLRVEGKDLKTGINGD